MRKIIHIDMDAFYASIEQRDNPQLRGLPLAVGHPGERGVVAAASYEARRYGVHSAMPSRSAAARCPRLVFVPARFEVYKEVSRQIMDIFLDYTDRVEPLALDEAYLDVTTNHYNMPSATVIASEIRRRIRETTGLTASAGVSVNKFLAKIASDYRKPDGLTVVTAEQAEAFVEGLRIEQFWGVGKVTAERMHGIGIHTGADLKMRSEAELVWHFGKAGHTYYLNARAIDNREVTPERIRKSVGSENTFAADTDERDALERELRTTAEEVWRRAGRRDFYGRTVTLKIKYADFRQITRSHTFADFITEYGQFLDTSLDLLAGIDLEYGKVRLLGLSIGNPGDTEQPRYGQLEFDFPEW
ncbi:MAG TPA: DNA polymerase IV [Candidatus Tidjanibacter gallistercoris]|nr:DNA polymerase IV [Candidatus Tidjanibacter gallistercoris]